MTHRPCHVSGADPRVLAAWHAQSAAVAPHAPWQHQILARGVWPQFAAHYTRLRRHSRQVRRVLQRQWRLPLAGIALMLALGQQPVQAATIPVGGACTLVDAITAANTDTATGGCLAGSGADTIVLRAGSTQTLAAVNNNTYGPTGLPVIRSAMTIAGNGSTIARASEAPEFRLFAVSQTGELTLNETTVSGGVAFFSSSDIDVFGGGVANFSGTLTVMNSTISDNAAGRGGGVSVNSGGTCTITNSTLSDNAGVDGGGMVIFGGICTVTTSTLSGNAAYSGGGVSVNYGGALTMTDSIISYNNSVGGYGYGGGGVANLNGTCTITNSTISNNSAAWYGGGVANVDSCTITNSIISNNSAPVAGSGVFNGGALIMTNSTVSGNSSDGVVTFGFALTMTNSTISGNSYNGVLNFGYGGTVTITNSTISGNFGTGVRNLGWGYGDGGTVTITNSTISGNFDTGVHDRGYVEHPNTITLVRTLVTGNTADRGPEIYSAGATILADNHNLFGVDGNARVVGFSPGPTDVVPPAGVLLPDILNPTLAFNGGPTQTHALVPGSPAIDAGGTDCPDANGDPLLTDQRGKPRIVDGNGEGLVTCDIGAFEFFPLVNDFVALEPEPDTAFDPTPVSGGPAGTFTITATFTNTSATPLRFPFFTVTELSGGHLLLNADEGGQGVGATLTPGVGDSLLSPGETVAVDFVIGLQAQERFRFVVDLFGEPVH